MRVLLVSLLALPLAALAADKEVAVANGKSVIVTLPFAAGRGANSNPDVVQGNVDGKRVILFGRAPGYSTYTFWSKDRKRTYEIDVTVVEHDAERIKVELEKALAEFEAVTVEIRGGNVFVEGEVATEDELRKVGKIVAPWETKGVQNDVGTGP